MDTSLHQLVVATVTTTLDYFSYKSAIRDGWEAKADVSRGQMVNTRLFTEISNFRTPYMTGSACRWRKKTGSSLVGGEICQS